MIESFAEYVNTHCKKVTVEQAESYAKRGEEFLRQIAADAQIKEQDMAAASTCVLWCLMKHSYDDNKPFGKGMFNLAFTDDAHAQKLFDMMRDSPKSYSRHSTHYNDCCSKQIGLDNHPAKNPDYVPSPWRFKTICMGVCTEPDGSTSLFMKPETEGTDFRRDPLGATKHFINLIISIFIKEKVPGTQSFRENGAMRDEMQGDAIQRGNEIRFLVDPKQGVQVKPKENLETQHIEIEVELQRFGQAKIEPKAKQAIIEYFNKEEQDIHTKLNAARLEKNPKKQNKLFDRIKMQLFSLQKIFLKFLKVNNNSELEKVAQEFGSKPNYLLKKKSWVYSRVKVEPLLEQSPKDLEKKLTKILRGQ